MPIKRWDPLQDLISIHQEIFGEGAGLGMAEPSRSAWTPATDIYETADKVVLNAEMPGVDPEKIKVEFRERKIVIHGERLAPEDKKERKYHQVERIYGPFERVIPMPSYICCEEIEAAYRDGVLTITVPKQIKQTSKVIKVKG